MKAIKGKALASLMTVLAVVEYFRTRPLITEENAKFLKMAKTSAGRWLQAGLTLSPALEAAKFTGGLDMCPRRSPGCTGGCLKTTARQSWDRARLARIRRTVLWHKARPTFKVYLERDLQRVARRARRLGAGFVFRFDTMSDVAIEEWGPELLQLVTRGVDYTKRGRRYRQWLRGRLPGNLHLTFSRSESNERTARRFLSDGGTVSIVCRDDGVKTRLLTEGRAGFPAIDGDVHDRRWEDSPGHWLALTAKGRARFDNRGFVID